MSEIGAALDAASSEEALMGEADILYNFIRLEMGLREAVQFCRDLRAGSEAMQSRLTDAANVMQPLMNACATQIAKIKAMEEAND